MSRIVAPIRPYFINTINHLIRSPYPYQFGGLAMSSGTNVRIWAVLSYVGMPRGRVLSVQYEYNHHMYGTSITWSNK